MLYPIEMKERAIELYVPGIFGYKAVRRILLREFSDILRWRGRAPGIETIRYWVNPRLAHRSKARVSKWRIRNPEQDYENQRNYRDTPLGRAKDLAKGAAWREVNRRDDPVPISDRVNTREHVPIASYIIENSPWNWDLTKRYPNGTLNWSPSFSRIDHSNPRYTNNFVIEPMWINARRDRENPEGCVCPWVYDQLSPEDILKIEYEPIRIDDPRWDFLRVSA